MFYQRRGNRDHGYKDASVLGPEICQLHTF
jgi:hypothetical protein